MNEKYIDCLQECHACSKEFIIRVYQNGSYDYLTDTCDCESEFSPCNGELSISQCMEVLKPIYEIE